MIFASKHLKRPHVFFVTVMLGPHKDSGNFSQHFMKPGDHEDISDSKTLRFVQGAGLLNEWAKRLHTRSITAEVLDVTQCLPFCNLVFSILFYSNSGDKMMNFTSKRHLGRQTKTREEKQCEPSSAAILTMHCNLLPLPQEYLRSGMTKSQVCGCPHD